MADEWSGDEGRRVKMIKILKMIKMLRMIKMIKIWGVVVDHLEPAIADNEKRMANSEGGTHGKGLAHGTAFLAGAVKIAKVPFLRYPPVGQVLFGRIGGGLTAASARSPVASQSAPQERR